MEMQLEAECRNRAPIIESECNIGTLAFINLIETALQFKNLMFICENYACGLTSALVQPA